MAPHRRYTKGQKVVAITAALASTVAAAAEQMGIPERTLGYWYEQPEFAELRTKTREDMAKGSMLLANLAQSELQRKVKAGEVEPRDLAVIYGIAIDKAQLLAGHATERFEHRDLAEFTDHETEAIVDAARKHLAGDTGSEDTALVEEPAVEGAGAAKPRGSKR